MRSRVAFRTREVVGVDLAEAMLAEARRKTPAELAERVRFENGDASALPFPDASFDLVAHANMIPFFDELARVLAPGGHALFAFSLGPGTPIYVPLERVKRELAEPWIHGVCGVRRRQGDSAACP